MSKTLLKTVLVTIGLLLFLFSVTRGVGTYFLDSLFTSDDAAALADPYTTEPGGQSVDAVETDGALATSGGELVVTKQASAVDGDTGLRYATAITDHIGKAMVFKVKYTELANGIAGSGNCATAIGFTGAATVKVDDIVKVGIGTTLSTFRWKLTQTASGFASMPEIPTTTDSFYCAIILGGYNSTTLASATPWYSGGGLDLSTFITGITFFIKKNRNGKWIQQAICRHSGHSTAYAGIGTYNASFKVDNWRVLGDSDSLYTPYLQPAHYQSCDLTSGQLFDDTPEVGTAYDSTNGDFVFSSNAVFANGSSPGAMGYISTIAFGDSNASCYLLSNIDNSSTGRFSSIVLRHDGSDGKFMMVQISTTADAIQIYDFDGTSTYTLRGTTAVALPNNSTYVKVLGAAIMDSSVYGWVSETTAGATSTVSYAGTGAITQYGQGLTRHGIRMGETTTGLKVITWHETGHNNEYSGLDQYFVELANSAPKPRKRRLMSQ